VCLVQGERHDAAAAREEPKERLYEEEEEAASGDWMTQTVAGAGV
jgi:hypothetical protein